MKFIAWFTSVPEHEVDIMVSGDDAIIITESQHVNAIVAGV
jgi:hypothetical protein